MIPAMRHRIKLPHYTRYVSGHMLRLDWLISVSVNDYDTARPLDWHRHDETEIIFPVRGRFCYEFRSASPVELDRNAPLVIPRGISHRLAEAIDAPGLRFSFHLTRPTGRFAAKGTFSAGEYARLHAALAGKALRRIAATPLLKSMVVALSRLVNRDRDELSEDDRLRARLLCGQILCDTALAQEDTSRQSPDRTFAQALQWIEANYSQHVTMDQFVAHIGYSRARFFELFKRQVGMTPGECLRNCRIEKAKELLARTRLPAAQVGRACGFGDPAHFSRLFSKMTGFTPISYRRRPSHP